MQKNSVLLSNLWLVGGNDYQQRVPSPTIATQAQTMRAIFDPANTSAYNAFVDNLINRIGLTYARQQEWRNPLAAFKRGDLPFGSTVQELQTGWLKAHSYEDDKQTLLKISRPEVKGAYHEISRADQYEISLNRLELKQAFVSETGLNSLIASVMQSPINSEQYDEYRQMLQCISWYESNWGFFKINGDAPDDDTSAKAFLKSLKAMVERLAFPSARYNAQILDDIAVFAKPQEMILLITPEASASVDVDALATLFHLEPTDAQVRKVIVDEFPIPGAYAMLTTRDWFQVYNIDYSNTSFFNPQNLSTNYYLTVLQIISCSPFVPAIVWTTEPGTETGSITQTVSTNAVEAAAFRRNSSGALEAVEDRTFTVADIKAGNAYVRGVSLDGTLSDGTSTGTKIGNVEVKPTAIVPTGYAFSGASIVANRATYIDRNGRLHLQAAALRADTDLTLTISYESAYRNPSGATPTPQTSNIDVIIKADTSGGGGGDTPSITLGYKVDDGATMRMQTLHPYDNVEATIPPVTAGSALVLTLTDRTGGMGISSAKVTYDNAQGIETEASFEDTPDGWIVSVSDAVAAATEGKQIAVQVIWENMAGSNATVTVTATE